MHPSFDCHFGWMNIALLITSDGFFIWIYRIKNHIQNDFKLTFKEGKTNVTFEWIQLF